jgi:viroplasmin and RNaseH domain-containing protein
MSDIGDINSKEVEANQPSADEVKDKAVQDYKDDMFKYKERMKSAQSELEAVLAEKAALERNQLEKNEEWKVLYEREKSERESAVSELQQKSTQFMDSSKKNAVVQQLGGFKKDEYSRFIDVSNIEVTDNGTFSSESLSREVERVRQTFPELLKAFDGPKLPGGAPSPVTVKDTKVSASMSRADLLAQYVKLKS